MVEPTTDNRPVDLEKGAEYETEEPELLENLIAPSETQHEELAAASKPLMLTEKILVCLLVVSFVLAEAYFVGVSLLNQQSTNSTNIDVQTGTEELGARFPPLMPEVSTDSAKELTIPEPLEDFEGGLSMGAVVGVIDANVPTRLPGEKLKADGDPQLSMEMKHFTVKIDIVPDDTRLWPVEKENSSTVSR